MCYKFAEENLSWNEAQTNCESENGHLATVNSRYVLLLVTVFIYLFFVVYFDYVIKELLHSFSLPPLKSLQL